jgi:hypothetical protein
MRHRTLDRIALIGFLLLYFAVMGSLIVLDMPTLHAYEAMIFEWVMLPAGVAGLSLIVFEKMQASSDDWP